MITDHHIKALLLALGDDPAPAIACINHLSPELLCFFLPESHKDTIESLVQPQITKMPQRWDWILTTDPDSFVQSHQAITKNLPNILKTWGVQPGELVMDFSTATPAIAAAVALASRPFISKVVQLMGAAGSSSQANTVRVGGRPKGLGKNNP